MIVRLLDMDDILRREYHPAQWAACATHAHTRAPFHSHAQTHMPVMSVRCEREDSARSKQILRAIRTLTQLTGRIQASDTDATQQLVPTRQYRAPPGLITDEARVMIRLATLHTLVVDASVPA